MALLHLTLLTLLAFKAFAQEEPSFQEYLLKFNKQYEDAELPERQAIYEARVAEIRKHNAQPGVLWEMHVNKFADVKLDEVSPRRRRDRNWSDSEVADQRLQRDRNSSDAEVDDEGLLTSSLARVELSETRDWRMQEPPVLPPVRDQGTCGDCWALAATEAMESRAAIRTGIRLELSSQYIADCAVKEQRRPDCNFGGFPKEAYRYAKLNGIPLAQEYPRSGKGEECRYWKAEPVVWVNGYRKTAENNGMSFMRALQHGPLSAAVDFDSDKLLAYRSGIFHGCSKQRLAPSHSVLLVGYGKVKSGAKYWIVQNSWGSDWGEDGFIRLRRYDEEPCASDEDDGLKDCGECGLLVDGSYPIGVSVEERRRLRSDGASIHV